MKFSAYNYHTTVSHFHGIAASTARPFSPPTAFRTTPRSGMANPSVRTCLRTGVITACWIPVQGVKDANAKVKELF
ncbi:hypothetical protein BJV78DRAFT_1258849, partial [Lactifluus subvellereus]